MTTSTPLQEQARALGDPTRYAIFGHVAQAGRPVGIAELNEHFPFNHNAIRQHLAKLVAAGLVIESKDASAGRGRPRLVYELAPAAAGQWGTTGPYERLSRLLVEIIRSGLEPEEVGRRAAHQFRVASPSGDVVADLRAAMARQGFSPDIVETRHGAEIVLHHCPFSAAALADRDTVCSLHLGIADGLVAGSAAAVQELVANDPRRSECKIRLRLGAEIPEPRAGRLSLRTSAGARS
jgi:predicted ArsR family transcriptional regulator